MNISRSVFKLSKLPGRILTERNQVTLLWVRGHKAIVGIEMHSFSQGKEFVAFFLFLIFSVNLQKSL